MNILFVHQNFPGQFKHLAPALARSGEHRVKAFSFNPGASIDAVDVIPVSTPRRTTPGIHPWVGEFESKVIRGEAVYLAAKRLHADGFVPDIIVAHPGWGESLFLKDVWPGVPLGLYCEFYYRSQGADVNFDPEFPDDPNAAARLRVKNAFYEMQLPYVQAGLAPTQWQKSTFPDQFQQNISVIHDGIDTQLVRPNATTGITFTKGGQKIVLTKSSEVITFVVRNLEPYRGYHQFMRALPDIMRQRPDAHILIVGGDDVSYGARPPAGPSGQAVKGWKDIFLSENLAGLDLSRLHFLGRIRYEQFLHVLHLSTVHVYLTYPFVLSWSLLEAMSAGCAIVGSDTPPVREVIDPGKTGLLVDFFDPPALAQQVVETVRDAGLRAQLGARARDYVIGNFDLKTICLPAQIDWLKSLA